MSPTPPIFHYLLPSPALREYVRLFQLVGCQFPAGVALPMKAYWPRPEQSLSFSPRDPERIAYDLAGPPVDSPGCAPCMIAVPFVEW